MILAFNIPIDWFDDVMSTGVCLHLNLRIIKAGEWSTYPEYFEMAKWFPKNFKLDEYLNTDKLHAVEFNPFGQTPKRKQILFHPDKLIKLSKAGMTRTLTPLLLK